MTTLEELLYQTAAHAIEQQQRHVAELRARTATLLAAAAISASFLGATAVESAGISVPVVLAIAALVGTIGLCLYVLTPNRMAFALDVATLHQALPDEVDDALAHVHLAARLHATDVGNRPLVEMLDARFRGASVLLVVDLVLWIAALTVT